MTIFCWNKHATPTLTAIENSHTVKRQYNSSHIGITERNLFVDSIEQNDILRKSREQKPSADVERYQKKGKNGISVKFVWNIKSMAKNAYTRIHEWIKMRKERTLKPKEI